MSVRVKLTMSPTQEILLKRGLNKGGNVQRFFTHEVRRLSDPYVPMKSGMIWFYTCGKVDKRTKSNKVLYRFDCDSSYIYSAFLSQYRLDLQELPYMHWWKFRSLLQGLSEENEFIKIIGYRAMEISSKMTIDQKRFYKKMKEQHKIPMSEKKSRLISEVEEALMNGGDIGQLLGG